MNILNGKRRRVREIKQTATTGNEWSTQEVFIGGYLLHISTHSIYIMSCMHGLGTNVLQVR